MTLTVIFTAIFAMILIAMIAAGLATPAMAGSHDGEKIEFEFEIKDNDYKESPDGGMETPHSPVNHSLINQSPSDPDKRTPYDVCHMAEMVALYRSHIPEYAHLKLFSDTCRQAEIIINDPGASDYAKIVSVFFLERLDALQTEDFSFNMDRAIAPMVNGGAGRMSGTTSGTGHYLMAWSEGVVMAMRLVRKVGSVAQGG